MFLTVKEARIPLKQTPFFVLFDSEIRKFLCFLFLPTRRFARSLLIRSMCSGRLRFSLFLCWSSRSVSSRSFSRNIVSFLSLFKPHFLHYCPPPISSMAAASKFAGERENAVMVNLDCVVHFFPQLMSQAELDEKKRRLEQTLQALKGELGPNQNGEVSDDLHGLNGPALVELCDLQDQRQLLQRHLETLKENLQQVKSFQALAAELGRFSENFAFLIFRSGGPPPPCPPLPSPPPNWASMPTRNW